MRIKLNAMLSDTIMTSYFEGDFSIKISHISEQLILSLGNEIFKYKLDKTKLIFNHSQFDFKEGVDKEKELSLFKLMRNVSLDETVSMLVDITLEEEDKIVVDIKIENRGR